METNYTLKKLIRGGTALLFLLAFMLTGTFSALGQNRSTGDLVLKIDGPGTVNVSWTGGAPGNIVGPVTSTLAGLPSGTEVTLNVTYVDPCYVIDGWTADPGDVTTVDFNQLQFRYVMPASGNAVVSLTFNEASPVISAVNPASTTQTVCVNTNIDDIVYNLTGNYDNVTVAGLPNGVSGTYTPTGTFTIAGTPDEYGIFTYTVTVDSACEVLTATGTITVNPDAVLTHDATSGSLDQTVCRNVGIQTIVFTAEYGTISIDPVAAPTGFNYDGVGTTTLTISGASTPVGGFTHVFTITADSDFGCDNDVATVTITVNDDAYLALTSAVGTDAQTVCINTAITNITYDVTGNYTGANITGLPGGVTGTYASGVFTISGSPDTAGLFTYTLTAISGCVDATVSGTITVDPDATITHISGTGALNQEVCINSPIEDIGFQLGGTFSTATLTWDTDPGGVSIGALTAGVVTLTGSPATAGDFVYTVEAEGICENATISGTLTVNPLPDVLDLAINGVSLGQGGTINIGIGADITATIDEFVGDPAFTVSFTFDGGTEQVVSSMEEGDELYSQLNMAEGTYELVLNYIKDQNCEQALGGVSYTYTIIVSDFSVVVAGDTDVCISQNSASTAYTYSATLFEGTDEFTGSVAWKWEVRKDHVWNYDDVMLWPNPYVSFQWWIDGENVPGTYGTSAGAWVRAIAVVDGVEYPSPYYPVNLWIRIDDFTVETTDDLLICSTNAGTPGSILYDVTIGPAGALNGVLNTAATDDGKVNWTILDKPAGAIVGITTVTFDANSISYEVEADIPGDYELRYEVWNGTCYDDFIVEFEVRDYLTDVTIDPISVTTQCVGESFTFCASITTTADPAIGTVTPVAYLWTVEPATGFVSSDPTGQCFTITPTVAGIYTVTVKATDVCDTEETSTSIAVTATPLLNINDIVLLDPTSGTCNPTAVDTDHTAFYGDQTQFRVTYDLGITGFDWEIVGITTPSYSGGSLTGTVTGLGSTTNTLVSFAPEDLKIGLHTFTITAVYDGCPGAGKDYNFEILPPFHARFRPTYDHVRPADDINNPVENVPVYADLNVWFSRMVYDTNSKSLPTANIGDFVVLEVEVATNTYELVPFTATLHPNDDQLISIQLLPAGTQLEYNTRYRIGFAQEVFKCPGGPTAGNNRVIYTLDAVANAVADAGITVYNEDARDFFKHLGIFDPYNSAAYVQDRFVYFETQTECLTTAPVIYPITTDEPEPVCIGHDEGIYVHFQNPVRYLSGVELTPAGDPAHKFRLQVRTGDPTAFIWEDVPFRVEMKAAEFEGLADDDYFYDDDIGKAGPTKLYIVPVDADGQDVRLEFDQTYRVVMNPYVPTIIGDPASVPYEYGFIDLHTGCNVLGKYHEQLGSLVDWPSSPDQVWWPTNEDGQQWTFTTVPDYEIKVTLNWSELNPEYFNNANFNQVTVDGAPVVGTSGVPAVPSVMTETFMITYGAASFDLLATPGEGYWFKEWQLPGGVVTTVTSYLFNTVDEVHPAHTFCNLDPKLYKAIFDINNYRVTANVEAIGTFRPGHVQIDGGTPSDFSVFANYKHGDANKRIDATPKLGYYLTHITPAPVAGNSGTDDPFANEFIPYETSYPQEPNKLAAYNFNTPQPGLVTYTFLGALINNDRWTVTTRYAPFTPRVDAEVITDTQYILSDYNNEDVGRVIISTEFTGGIVESGTGWMRFLYETPITLTPVSDQCGWEFSHWKRWKENYDGTGARVYEDWLDFDGVITMDIIENYDIQAVFTRKKYDVFAGIAPTSPANGTVRIHGTDDVNGVPVDDWNPTDYYTFFYNEDKLYDPIYITVFPDNGYEVKGWTGNQNLELVDKNNARSIYRYYVECVGANQPNVHDILFELGLIEYQISGQPDFFARGTVTGTPVGVVPSLNRFTNNAINGTTSGIFQHFEGPLTLTATSKALWEFSHWHDAKWGIVQYDDPVYVIEEVTEERTLTAIFKPDLPQHPITITHKEGVNEGVGTTNPEVLPGNSYYHTDTYSFTAIANPGYVFDEWEIVSTHTPAELNAMFGGNFAANFDPNNETIEFTMPDAPVELVAHYTLRDYTVIVTSLTYIYDGVMYDNILENQVNLIANPVGTYNYGQQFTFNAVADPGFVFVNWMEGDFNAVTNKMTGYQIEGSTTLNFEIPAQHDGVIEIFALFREVGTPRYPLHIVNTSVYPAGKAELAENDGAGQYPETVDVELTCGEPIAGWHFTHWTVVGGITSTYMSCDPTISMTGGSPYLDQGLTYNAVAHYALTDYLLTANAPFGLGTVVVNGSVPASTATKVFNIESPVIQVSAQAIPNWEFDKWTWDAAGQEPVNLPGIGEPDATFSYIPSANNVTFYAQFKRVSYNITTSEETIDSWNDALVGGTTTVTPADGPYLFEDIVTLEAVAEPGYEFLYWKDGAGNFIIIEGVEPGPVFDYEVIGNMNFVAWFRALPRTVDVTAGPNGSFSVDPDYDMVDDFYTIQEEVTVTALPDAGYRFKEWINVTGVVLTDVNDPVAVFEVGTLDITLEATFEPIPYPLVLVQPTGGTIAGPATYTVEDVVTLTATPDDAMEWFFVKWIQEDGEAVVDAANEGDNPLVINNPPIGGMTFTAEFDKHEYTLTYGVSTDQTAGNTITGTAPGVKNLGDPIELTAVANAAGGWEFDMWTVEFGTLPVTVDLTEETIEFTMPAGSVELIANFIEIPYTVEGQVRFFGPNQYLVPNNAVHIEIADEDPQYNRAELKNGVIVNSYFEFERGVAEEYHVTLTIDEADLPLYRETATGPRLKGVGAADALAAAFMLAGADLGSDPFDPSAHWIGAPIVEDDKNNDVTPFVYAPFAEAVRSELDPLRIIYRSLGTFGYPEGVYDLQAGANVGNPLPGAGPANTFDVAYNNGTYTFTGVVDAGEWNPDQGKVYIYLAVTGDLNLSFNPTSETKTSDATINQDNIIDAEIGEIIDIPVTVKAGAEIGAATLGLGYRSDLIEILNVNMAANILGDEVLIGWIGNENTVIITATVLSDISVNDQLFHATDFTEIVANNTKIIDEFELISVAVTTEGVVDVPQIGDGEFVVNNFPNPFNTNTTIEFSLPEAAEVKVVVMNQMGQVVETLVNEKLNSGTHSVEFYRGSHAPGIYFYNIVAVGQANTYSKTNSMIIVQ